MNIVLCGFMGAGKTRIGKEISKLTGREFIDTDDIVEKSQAKKLPISLPKAERPNSEKSKQRPARPRRSTKTPLYRRAEAR